MNKNNILLTTMEFYAIFLFIFLQNPICQWLNGKFLPTGQGTIGSCVLMGKSSTDTTRYQLIFFSIIYSYIVDMWSEYFVFILHHKHSHCSP